ncbi:MATE family efflux transporter [Branchiibius hedensis]|uniref:MATE family efflux transporter n=1 Tax=Branchiibius hedensis TaxID=672460 RepID=UPI001FE2B2E6|nr:MATE family efflux transporter [Branchiibius hedensis]
MPSPTPTTVSARQIAALAVPAFLALIVEPLFLLADTAIVGHLGTVPLAGLGVASAALLTGVNVFVFLAYGTTALVARRMGAGQESEALAGGVDGIWLSIVLGAVTAIVVGTCAEPICRLFGASDATVDQAVIYLRISAIGIPGMLVILAATGVLRGLLDTRTPLIAATIGFAVNIALNYLLVYPAGLGIAGSAWGTVIAQTGMGIGLGLVVAQQARAKGARLTPHPAGVLTSATSGVPLLVRTLALRGALLLDTWLSAGVSTVVLAANQVSMTVFSFMAFALDALAIAAQTMTGRALGAGDRSGARQLTRILTWWGLGLGFALAVLLAATHTVLPVLFTNDRHLQQTLGAALLVLAVLLPVCGVVFVLDGVLIGAGDGRALAWLQVLVLLGYAPVVIALRARAHELAGLGDSTAMVIVWLAFGWFLVLRCIGLGLRARSDHWLVTGS